MALVWTLLLLLKLLLTQTSEAVDEAELAKLVNDLLNTYRPNYQVHGDTPTFTLAVSIPFDKNTKSYDFKKVTDEDKAAVVRAALDGCQVYQGGRVMGARVLKWPDVIKQCPDAAIPAEWTFVKNLCPNVKTWGEISKECAKLVSKADSPNGRVDHAEYRVLQRFNHLVDKLNTKKLEKNDLMLFYSYKSPCDARCANPANKFSILESIKSITAWSNHVLVFSQIFVPGKTKFDDIQLEKNLRTSLVTLGNAINCLGNVYRCVSGSDRCTKCAAQTGVADACVRDVPKVMPSRSKSAPVKPMGVLVKPSSKIVPNSSRSKSPLKK